MVSGRPSGCSSVARPPAQDFPRLSDSQKLTEAIRTYKSEKLSVHFLCPIAEGLVAATYHHI